MHLVENISSWRIQLHFKWSGLRHSLHQRRFLICTRLQSYLQQTCSFYISKSKPILYKYRPDSGTFTNPFRNTMAYQSELAKPAVLSPSALLLTQAEALFEVKQLRTHGRLPSSMRLIFLSTSCKLLRHLTNAFMCRIQKLNSSVSSLLLKSPFKRNMVFQSLEVDEQAAIALQRGRKTTHEKERVGKNKIWRKK